jgi:thymidylate synthase (FAD)
MHTAKIVAITNPQITDSVTGMKFDSQEFIAYCARVSNPSNQMNRETSEKLLKYCIRNNHWSVFEMSNIVMQIDTTRDIARQILRHRSFSFQEFSQRYADPTADLGFSLKDCRMQDNKNRQNSIENSDTELAKDWDNIQDSIIKASSDAYAWALSKGIAKEQARAVLPEGLIKSRLYMNGTLRSWIHYITLRSGNGTQKEHRDVAISAGECLIEKFSFLHDMFKEAQQ